MARAGGRIRHHSCRPGRWVEATLAGGERIVAQFGERNDRFLDLQGHPRIPWKRVARFRMLSIREIAALRSDDPTAPQG